VGLARVLRASQDTDDVVVGDHVAAPHHGCFTRLARHLDRPRPGRRGLRAAGLRFSLSHIGEGQWRARFMSSPMFAPAGFGVAPTPWQAVQRAAWAAVKGLVRGRIT